MNSRLSAFDYIVSLIIILLLVGNVASFYYGVQFGANDMQQKYETMLNKNKKPDRSKDEYHQEHIVSYYYNVMAPNRVFEKEWFSLYDDLRYDDSVPEVNKRLDRLRDTATEQLKNIRRIPMPDASSYLVIGQKKTIQSLELFIDAINEVYAGANSLTQAQLLSKINKSVNYIEARSFALEAREEYFAGIVEWNLKYVGELDGYKLSDKRDVTEAQWKTMNLNLKNKVMAQILADSKSLTFALPQDFVSRVDALIRNGQMQALKFKTIGAAVDNLAATDAVRDDDFSKVKDSYYGDELLPTIPLFE